MLISFNPLSIASSIPRDARVGYPRGQGPVSIRYQSRLRFQGKIEADSGHNAKAFQSAINRVFDSKRKEVMAISAATLFQSAINRVFDSKPYYKRGRPASEPFQSAINRVFDSKKPQRERRRERH